MKSPLIWAVGLAFASTASAAWQRLPYTGARNLDIVTTAISESKVKSSKGISNVEALLDDDSTVSTLLKNGGSNVVFELGNQASFSELSFVNDGAAGSISVSGSLDGKSWSSLGQETFAENSRYVAVTFAGAQARYVRVEFDTHQSGTIRCMVLSSLLKSTEEYQLQRAGQNSLNEGVDLAEGIGGARPVYVHPTPENVGQKNLQHNLFDFPKTEGTYRTVVYDLGSQRQLTRFGAAYTQVPVQLDVYVLDRLPETKDWRGKIILNSDGLTSEQPVASGLDSDGVGNMSFSSSNKVSGRYVVFRFQPHPTKVALLNGNGFDAIVSEGLSALGLQGEKRPVVGASKGGFVVYGLDIISPDYRSIPSNHGGNDEKNAQDVNPENDPNNPNTNGQDPQTGYPGQFYSDPYLYQGAFPNYGAGGYGTGGRGSTGGLGYRGPIDDDDDEPTVPVIPPTTP